MTLEFLLWKRHKNEECIQQLFQIYLNWCLIFQYPSLFTCLSTVKQGQVQPNTVHYRQVQPSTSPPPPSLVSFPDRSRNIRLGHYFANQWRVEVAKWETRNLPCRKIWNMSTPMFTTPAWHDFGITSSDFSSPFHLKRGQLSISLQDSMYQFCLIR